MKTNVGRFDSGLRIVTGLGIFVVLLLNIPLDFTSAFVLLGILASFILVVTGLLRSCPAYRLIGLSTCGRSGAK
ncbi:MAG: DUF2892 domain-containing protein [Pseudomonadota bacterium]